MGQELASGKDCRATQELLQERDVTTRFGKQKQILSHKTNSQIKRVDIQSTHVLVDHSRVLFGRL